MHAFMLVMEALLLLLLPTLQTLGFISSSSRWRRVKKRRSGKEGSSSIRWYDGFIKIP